MKLCRINRICPVFLRHVVVYREISWCLVVCDKHLSQGRCVFLRWLVGLFVKLCMLVKCWKAGPWDKK